MEKKESVSKILGLVTMYNQKLSQYVKDYRNYGTPQKLRSDQIHLICHIGRNPKCNLRYLAEATGACFPTVSLQVDRLRNIGLVTKTRSSANQREIESH
ncbi:MAG: winged helix-turn-helix transcriptional regulator [Clostridium sp.]|nr:winged helix-turn-helix transcriptional regulator [Clostridium sp.]